MNRLTCPFWLAHPIAALTHAPEREHLRAEAATAHESYCRSTHWGWRAVAAEAAARAERDRLAAVVEMVHRLAHEALLDPSHLLAFAEAVVHATDTQASAATLTKESRTEGGTHE